MRAKPARPPFSKALAPLLCSLVVFCAAAAAASDEQATFALIVVPDTQNAVDYTRQSTSVYP